MSTKPTTEFNNFIKDNWFEYRTINHEDFVAHYYLTLSGKTIIVLTKTNPEDGIDHIYNIIKQ